ncbi:basic proline-rich protein-like [Molothrus ater]|uniref:basic proline-rich protein-like n=1 Tax=Molothrus ater TaxID=84834 RepID=UPI0017499FE2|nr:basic proline-rich protein-like [Molothrus ater]
MVIPLVLHHLPRHHAEPLLPSQFCLHLTVLLYNKELPHKVRPCPRAARPSPRLPGAAVGSAPSSGHLVTCREEGAGPTVPSQGQHLRSPPPGAERSLRGAAPGTEPPAPCGTASGLPRGPEPPADGASRTPGLPNLPRPQHGPQRGHGVAQSRWSPGPRRDPEEKDVAAPGGSRCPPPAPARTHRVEPRDPPGRPPLPGTVRVPAAAAASRRLPRPGSASPGQGRPHRLLPTSPRRLPEPGPLPSPTFPISAAFFLQAARTSSL